MAVYLAHHGILGQKWGKRNGPPYPLDAEDHSAAEKRAAKQLTSDMAEADRKRRKADQAAAKASRSSWYNSDRRWRRALKLDAQKVEAEKKRNETAKKVLDESTYKKISSLSKQIRDAEQELEKLDEKFRAEGTSRTEKSRDKIDKIYEKLSDLERDRYKECEKAANSALEKIGMASVNSRLTWEQRGIRDNISEVFREMNKYDD